LVLILFTHVSLMSYQDWCHRVWILVHNIHVYHVTIAGHSCLCHWFMSLDHWIWLRFFIITCHAFKSLIGLWFFLMTGVCSCLHASLCSMSLVFLVSSRVKYFFSVLMMLMLITKYGVKVMLMFIDQSWLLLEVLEVYRMSQWQCSYHNCRGLNIHN